jgi:diguanylate cyclase (GGDEF)-like protein/PAS domain S-box-containing protein
LLAQLATLISYLGYERQHRQDIAMHARFDSGEYARLLQQGLQSFAHVNRYVTGLFAASGDVSAREFESYVKSVHALDSYQGLSYVGYLPRVATDRIAQFQAVARKTIPSYSVRSNQHDADSIYPLLYAVPDDDNAKRFIGFDYAVLPERREAMQAAAELGESVATRKLANLSSPSQKDFVFVFTPVYDAAKAVETLAQRRDALTGYVFSVFVIADVIERVMGARFKQQFDLEIYDGRMSRDTLLYDGDLEAHALAERPSSSGYTETIDFAGRRWILYFQPKEVYEKRYAGSNGRLILLCGGLASIVLGWLMARWQKRRQAQHQQAEHAQRFPAVFENHPSAVFALDTQWRIVNANAQAIQQLESSRDKLLGASVLNLLSAENLECSQQVLKDSLLGVAARYDTELVTGRGKRIEVSIVLIPVTTDGKVSGVLAIADNITERQQSERRLRQSQQMLQLVIDNIPQRVFWKDTELYFLGCNKAFCADGGLDGPASVVGKTDSDFPWKEQAEAYRRDDLHTMQSGIAKVNYEEAQQRRDGAGNWLRTSKIPLTNEEGQTVGVLGMYEDITERKLMQQRLEQMALYDNLSGLPNRAHFYARLEQALDRAERDNTLAGLMYFDIDKFKRINDNYGHDAGDSVIAEFGRRIEAAVREKDVIGRLGGDEFCLLLENLPNRQAAATLAAKLIDAMRPAMQIGQATLEVGISIGIAFQEPGITSDEMMRRADQAMYAAKQAGGNQFRTAQDDTQAV